MPDPLAPAWFADIPGLPPLLAPQRTYIGIRQRAWGTWMAEITDREMHTRKWVGSFHTVELAAMEYDRWQVQFHRSATRLNFPFETALVRLVLPAPGGMSAAMAREHREARKRLEAGRTSAASTQGS
nr:ethylene-responsive transcription factor ERF113-like [Aegilops tauschii subsp. strangulata]